MADSMFQRHRRRILGTAQLCAPYGVLNSSVGSSVNEAEIFLFRAKSAGFDALDTAPSYTGAEETIGSSSVNLSLHTKFIPGVSALDSIKASLQRLRADKVEIAYLHDPMAPITDGGRSIDEATVLTGDLFERLGTSVYSLDALEASLQREEIQVIQIPVNPLWREMLEAVPNRTSQTPLIYGRSLLAQGLLLIEDIALHDRFSHLLPFIRAFQNVCRTLDRSALECALLWSRDQPHLDGLILGATSIAHLEEISSALDAKALSPEERAMIDEIPIPDSPIFDPRSWS